MPKIVLHIGLQKTGTTFLQRHVLPNVDPTSVCFNPPSLLADIREVFRADYDPSVMKARLGSISGFMKSIAQPTVLISYEVMSGSAWKNYSDLGPMMDFLSRGFPESAVILVIRNQLEWLISLYKEGLRNGLALPIGRFINVAKTEDEDYRVSGVRALDFDFASLVAAVERRFSSQRTHLLFYEELRNDVNRFLNRFEEVLGAPIPRDFANIVEYPGLSTFEAWLLGYWRQLPYQSPRPRHRAFHPVYLLEGWLRKREKDGWMYRRILRDLEKVGVDEYSSRKRKQRQQLELVRWVSQYVRWQPRLLSPEIESRLRRHYGKVNQRLEQRFTNAEIARVYLYATEATEKMASVGRKAWDGVCVGR